MYDYREGFRFIIYYRVYYIITLIGFKMYKIHFFWSRLIFSLFLQHSNPVSPYYPKPSLLSKRKMFLQRHPNLKSNKNMHNPRTRTFIQQVALKRGSRHFIPRARPTRHGELERTVEKEYRTNLDAA